MRQFGLKRVALCLCGLRNMLRLDPRRLLRLKLCFERRYPPPQRGGRIAIAMPGEMDDLDLTILDEAMPLFRRGGGLRPELRSTAGVETESLPHLKFVYVQGVV